MKPFVAKFQIGKAGITENFIDTLAKAFKTRKQIRIRVLKSAGPDRDRVKELGKEVQEKLPFKTNCRIIGFTLVLIR